jgi:hypothetical protein
VGAPAPPIAARAGCAGDPPRVGEVVLGWSDQEEPMAGARGGAAVLGGAAARCVHLRRRRGGGYVSQAGHALGGRVRRRAAAPRAPPQGRCLSFSEREEIALARARGETVRAIPRRLGRAPSTSSRELRRNADRDGGYRATTAHARAYRRASRPKPAKLATNLALRRSCRTICGGACRPSRSPGGCAAASPASRRCGCPRRPSTSRSTSNRAGRSSAS